MTELNVRRADLGYLVRPATATGTGAARVERLLSFDPKRVVFAHDNAVWAP